MHEIPNHVSIQPGNGGLTKLVIHSDSSSAEIYLHGAHVTQFQKTGEPPMLFMSAASDFSPEKPIRGGIPLIYPWFGPREGSAAHGFARTSAWEIVETALTPDGAVIVHLQLPTSDSVQVDYKIRIADTLTADLIVTNHTTADHVFENCLHTYFQIGDVDTISVRGLQGCAYIDKLLGQTLVEIADAITISREVDRVYSDAAPATEIIDPTLNRKITVRKSGSKSTVVWNPWIAKSKAMADFGDQEFHQMICVESGNVGNDRITLAPGASQTLHLELS